MKTALKKPGLMMTMALLTGFVAGSYFPDQRAPREQTTEAGSRDVRGTAQEKLPRSARPISHGVGPQSAELRPGDVAHEIPPELLIRLTNGEYVLQYEFPSARLGLSNHVAMNVREYRPVIDNEYNALFKE